MACDGDPLMNQKVYLLQGLVPYEGCVVLGIFSTEDSARAAKLTRNNTCHTQISILYITEVVVDVAGLVIADKKVIL